MKYIPISLLLVFLPLLSVAENFSISINAGAALTGREKDGVEYVSNKMKTGPAGSFRFAGDIKGWQAGISIETGVIRNHISLDIPDTYFGDLVYTGYHLDYTEVLAPIHATSLLFINKKIKLRGSFLYAGVASGAMYILGSNNAYSGMTPGGSLDFGSALGLAFGAQAGYTLPVTKKLGVNAEIAYRRANIKYEVPGFVSDDYTSGPQKLEHTLIYMPLTFGVRYQL